MKYLYDFPSEQNDFGDSSSFDINKKLLVEYITSNNENKLIALSGKWGSGKSSVLKMIGNNEKEEENNKENKIDVITFDVFNHSEDQVRRSFLMTLYKELKIKDYDDNKFKLSNRNNLEKYITGSVKNYEVKNKSKWNNVAKTFIFIFLSYIIIAAIYKPINFISQFYHFITVEKHEFWNGVGAFGTYFLLCILFSIFIIVKLIKDDKEYKWEDLKSITKWLKFIWEKLKSVWNNLETYIFPFVNGTSDVDQTSTEETYENDITVDNFIEIYDKIISLYREKNKDKYLLIAIDNLDRVEPEKVKNIITNLSLFVSRHTKDTKDTEDTKNTENTEKDEKVYYVVLIDKNHFFNFSEAQEDNKYNSNFFEKLFPVRFEISDVSNLDWRSFLKDKFTDATDYSENDFLNHVIWLYDEFSNNIIVPRDIIYFINKVVYNYKVMSNLENSSNKEEESTTENSNTKQENDINLDYLKGAIINALYSMFIEERKEKFENISSASDFVEKLMDSKKNYDKEKLLQRLIRLLNHFTNNWADLFYKSYYQTVAPYDVLYKNKMVSYLETNNVDKLNDIYDSLKKIDKDEYVIFENLLKRSIVELSNIYKFISTWKNVMDYLIYHKSHLLDSIKNNIDELLPSQVDEKVDGIGETCAQLYLHFKGEEDIVNTINKIFRKKYEEKLQNFIYDEYISFIKNLKENESWYNRVELFDYSELVLHEKIVSSDISYKIKGFLVSEKFKNIDTYSENYSQSIFRDYNYKILQLQANIPKKIIDDIIEDIKMLEYYVMFKPNQINLESLKRILFSNYFSNINAIYNELCNLIIIAIEHIEDIDTEYFVKCNKFITPIITSTTDDETYLLTVYIILVISNRTEIYHNSLSIENIRPLLKNNISHLYSYINDIICIDNFIKEVNNYNNQDFSILVYYHLIKDLEILKNMEFNFSLLSYDIIIETFFDSTVKSKISNYNKDSFNKDFRKFINYMYENINNKKLIDKLIKRIKSLIEANNVGDEIKNEYKEFYNYLNEKIN